MQNNEYTIPAFAKKIKKSRATVYRWITDKKYKLYLKMYDAEVVEVAGKRFIKIVKK